MESVPNDKVIFANAMNVVRQPGHRGAGPNHLEVPFAGPPPVPAAGPHVRGQLKPAVRSMA